MKNRIYSIYFHVIIACLLTLSVSSCKKDKDSESAEGTSQLVFSVEGINNTATNSINNKYASINRNNPSENAFSQIHLNNYIDLVSSAEEFPMKTSFDVSTPIATINKKLSTTTPVQSGIKYRIMIYNADTNQLIKNVEATVGVTESVPVEVGVNYKWYAYSFNTEHGIDPASIVGTDTIIAALSDKALLWAKSESNITATATATPLTITFEHKVAEIVIEIDTKNLFGKITSINATFDQTNFYTGTLNIRTGNVTPDAAAYTSPILTIEDFTQASSADSTIYRAYIYTTKPSEITSTRLKINSLVVKFDNGVTKEIFNDPVNPKLINFTFTGPIIARSHVASIDLRYNIPTKKILHVTGTTNSSNTNFSFAAQPGSNTAGQNRPPHSMLIEPRNYGTLPNSIVHTNGFTHQTVLNTGLKAALEGTTKPDIVIISLFYTMTSDDISALSTYLNDGGVVMMFVDFATGISTEFLAYKNFINAAFDVTNITLAVAPSYGGGSLFKLDHEGIINDKIITGPFGNLSGQFWGTDTHNVLVAENLSIGSAANQATIYSNPKPDNVNALPTGQVMFKHNSKSLFYIGNSSFLSTLEIQATGGWPEYPFHQIQVPFATVFLPDYPNTADPNRNYNNYPMPRRYGWEANSVGYTSNSMVYNAPLFANLMAWALYQSEMYGINRP